MTDRASPLLAQGFSNIGHSYSHIFTIMYPTIVLTLEREWGLPFGQLITLMLAGQILFGVAALPAGWLGDRWSMVGMMAVFFIGTGAAAILTGFAQTPFQLACGLALTGAFASIYHPVGMAWLLRAAVNRGRALGINGIFGGVGLALGPLIAGLLTDFISWRAVFIVPGVTAIVFGVVLIVAWATGYVVEIKTDIVKQPEPSRGDAKRAFFILSVTMLCTGLIGSAYQVMLPKVFAERMSDVIGGGALGAGSLVTVVYLFGALAQYVGGQLADRWGMKRTYMAAFMLQTPMVLLAGAVSGLPLLGFSIAMVFANLGSLASENGLLAHFTPSKWRATAYGAKFVLSLGVSATAIPVVAIVYDATGDFTALFLLMGLLAALVALAAIFLPSDREKTPAPVTAAAAAE